MLPIITEQDRVQATKVIATEGKNVVIGIKGIVIATRYNGEELLVEFEGHRQPVGCLISWLCPI